MSSSADAVKLVQPIFKRPDLTDERWHYHWRHVHGPVAGEITLLKRYVQLHRIAPVLPGLQPYGCSGIVEVWFDKLEDAVALGSDPTYLEGAHVDEPNFLDVERSPGYMTTERVLVEQDYPADAGKAVLLVSRRRGLDGAAFDERGAGYLDALASIPGLRRLGHHTVGEQPALPFHTVDILVFDTVAAMEDAWRSDQATGALEALQDVADMARTYGFAAHEQRIIW